MSAKIVFGIKRCGIVAQLTVFIGTFASLTPFRTNGLAFAPGGGGGPIPGGGGTPIPGGAGISPIGGGGGTSPIDSAVVAEGAVSVEDWTAGKAGAIGTE